MKKVSLDSIRHLIPDGCWYKDEKHDDYVLYCAGDQNWTSPRNLDELGITDNSEDFYPFILIQGNLTATQLFNEETDGSTGLIVLGNLKADNIVVGGQGIFVTGDLLVNGLFWGDYNHGYLEVAGFIQAKVFLNTDYGVQYERFKSREHMQIDHLLWDDQDVDYDDLDRMRRLFNPEFLLNEEDVDDEIYSWKDWLETAALFDALRNSRTLLRDDITPERRDDIPLFFQDEKINAANLSRFSESVLFSSDRCITGEDINIEYWEGDRFRRIFMKAGEPKSIMVYIEQEDEFACLLYFGFDRSELSKLLPQGELRFATSYRVFKEEPEIWHNLLLEQPSTYANFLQREWPQLLREYSEFVSLQERFESVITATKFDAVMDLALVKEKGTRYYSENYLEASVFFRGLQWQFRNKQELSGSMDEARISISEYVGEDNAGNACYDFYHYELREHISGQRHVVLLNQDESVDTTSVYQIDYTNREKFAKSLAYFDLLYSHIFRLNKRYLLK